MSIPAAHGIADLHLLGEEGENAKVNDGQYGSSGQLNWKQIKAAPDASVVTMLAAPLNQCSAYGCFSSGKTSHNDKQ